MEALPVLFMILPKIGRFFSAFEWILGTLGSQIAGEYAFIRKLYDKTVQLPAFWYSIASITFIRMLQGMRQTLNLTCMTCKFFCLQRDRISPELIASCAVWVWCKTVLSQKFCSFPSLNTTWFHVCTRNRLRLYEWIWSVPDVSRHTRRAKQKSQTRRRSEIQSVPETSEANCSIVIEGLNRLNNDTSVANVGKSQFLHSAAIMLSIPYSLIGRVVSMISSDM